MRWHRRRRVTQRLRDNHHQPFGLQAANCHLLRRRSSAISRIACVAAARICQHGACNATTDFSVTGHYAAHPGQCRSLRCRKTTTRKFRSRAQLPHTIRRDVRAIGLAAKRPLRYPLCGRGENIADNAHLEFAPASAPGPSRGRHHALIARPDPHAASDCTAFQQFGGFLSGCRGARPPMVRAQGRDIGPRSFRNALQVFPHRPPHVRAERRNRELLAKGRPCHSRASSPKRRP